MAKRSVIGWVWVLISGIPLSAPAQLKVGDNVEMTSSALVNVGYNGSYGNETQSNHGLQFGLDGNLAGYYYNPNFLNFDIIPYYNQSSANSTFQSVSDSSGITANVNFFSGSHFPGSVNYNYTYNNTGSLGQVGVPNFTTVGTGQGFGINWSALLPNWPTISVGYALGSGSGNVYGTGEKTQNTTHILNLRSSYVWAGFTLNGFYTHQTQNSNYPLFLTGEEEENSNTHGNNFGVNASHNLPWNGQFYANYNHSSYATDYKDPVAEEMNTSDYSSDYETAGANFHPTKKLALFASESYVTNLSGYLSQNLGINGILPPATNLGSNSDSFTVGGGASYSITQNLGTTAQATHYDQHYFGKTYTGTYISGTVNYYRRLWDTFTFSAGIVDFANGQGNNNVGLVGTVNAFRTFGRWDMSGVFSYTQNVQSVLITYTTSSYSYSANLHRQLGNRFQWTVAFNGSHSGLNQQPDTANHAENIGTTLTYKWISASALYANNGGQALLYNGSLVPLPPLPGEPNPNVVYFRGSGYGGGITLTPQRNLSISGNFSRAISDTLANSIVSHNNNELFYAQLQYRFRKIRFLAGWTRLTQGISASGTPPGTLTTYYAGISRWFDFF